MKVLLRRNLHAGFTLVEVIVASCIGLLVVTVFFSFTDLTSKSISGIFAQGAFNAKAGYSIQLMQLRTRLATQVSVDTTGRTLVLGFDDNYSVDSNLDGTPYNDADHYELFQFRNGDGDDTTVKDNSLIYMPRTNLTRVQVLLPSGLRILKNQKVFALTNLSTVLINYGLTGSTMGGRSQAIEIQGTAVPLNRSLATNYISILP